MRLREERTGFVIEPGDGPRRGIDVSGYGQGAGHQARPRARILTSAPAPSRRGWRRSGPGVRAGVIRYPSMPILRSCAGRRL